MSESLESLRFPLSAAQFGVWTAQHLNTASPRYNCASYLEIHGPVDHELMRRAVHTALQDAEPLRARFVGDGQLIAPVMPEPLELLDHSSQSDPDTASQEWMRTDLLRPVDVRTDQLVRHVLIRHTEQCHLLYLRHHHIVLDGFGQTLHWDRIGQVYSALAAGQEPPAAQSAPLADLLAEDAAYTASAAHDRDRDYWTEQLSDRPIAVGLSGRPAGPARQVLRRTSEMGAEDAALLHRLAADLGTTPPAVLMAAVAAYVCRSTAQEETLLNVPVAARRGKAARHTPAMLANHLPLRLAVESGHAFRDLVSHVTTRLSELLRHQRFRGEELHRVLGMVGTGEQLGGTTVNVMAYGGESIFAGLRSVLHFLWPGPVRDLVVNFSLSGDGSKLRLVLYADAELYDPAALAAHATRLTRLIRDALRRPDQRVRLLDLMEPEEQRAVLDSGLGPVRDYDLSRTLPELVEQQAVRTPNAVAVQTARRSLTYRQLIDAARRLATHLRGLGAGPGEVVGVHMERSLDLVVSLLAVQLAGAAYLPLDPELPPKRLAFQIEDAKVALVLSRSDLADQMHGTAVAALPVDVLLPELPVAGPLPATAGPDDTAYVIFTSGSTGQPKGVAVPHRGVVNRLLWMQEEYRLGSDDVVLQKTPHTFDVSVWEFFWPLLTGARLHIAEPAAHRDPRTIADAIRRFGVTTVHFVPTMLDLFLSESSATGLGSLRRVMASGEALRSETVARFFARYGENGPELHNLYGPTEASVDVTYWRCRPQDASGPVPIGRPVANTSVYVLDPGGRPVPFSTPGELYLGGVQVASGYLNRPELTAERFVLNPFGEGRLYRTGDLATLHEDGTLAYLGRLDHQVKVRGFRVELGEIESVLLSHPKVAQAVVEAPTQPDGQRRLVAHVVPADPSGSAEELATVLRTLLADRLPEYMIPQIQPLGGLPTLSNGKADRRALPALAAEETHRGPTDPPATEAERLLHDSWCEVLGLDSLDVCTSFFALGGDSILSIRMRAALERRGFTCTVADLFQAPTVRQLAQLIRPADENQEDRRTVPFALLKPSDRNLLPPDVEDAYPLSIMQYAMIYHAGFEEGISTYRVVTSVQLEMRFDESLMRRAIRAVFLRHPALRTSFHLTGFSEPLQLVHPQVEIPLHITHELLGLDPQTQSERLRAWADQTKHHQFDVTAAPLLAFTVHIRSTESFQLGVVEHHSVLDGWSNMLMMDEIAERYRALLAGEELWLPETPSSFHRFVAVERRIVESALHREFWVDELANIESAPLPRGSSVGRQEYASHRRFAVPVDGAEAGRIAEAARRAELPLKSMLIAAHVAVLRTVTTGPEVLTGVVSHGRLDEEGGDKVIGTFVNTLPLRIDTTDATWLQLAALVHAHEARTAPHRGYPYGQMVQDTPDLSLDSYVNFMDFHHEGGSERAMVEGSGIAETEFALTVNFMIDPMLGHLEVWLDCDLSVLDPVFCTRLTGYYARAIAKLAADPEAVAEAAALRGPAEVALTRRWNDTSVPYESGTTIDRLIDRQLRRAPEAPAVLHRDLRLNCAELDARANRLAHHLRSLGVDRGTRVGVNVGRGVDLVTTLLAVLRTGAAYVPLDPGFPAERLSYVAEDAGLACLVTDSPDRDALPARSLVNLRADATVIAARPAGPLEPRATVDDPAYIIYTSGSTGHPKGTVLLHRTVSNFFTAMDAAIGMGPRDTVLAATSMSFDISVLELLWPLARGAAIAVADDRLIETLTPGGADDGFTELVRRHHPTVLQATPSFVSAVAAEPDALHALQDLRILILGGEAFPSGLARQLLAELPGVRVINGYGPTEATVYTTMYELDSGRDAASDVIPIGRPLANIQLRVVGRNGRETPIGVSGELWIGGECLAAGYLGREELTTELFVPDPQYDGSRWYRTGDRVRYRQDGVVEFLGRLDRQVKVSGHRVELDEVESVLSRHPGVTSAAVIAAQRADGSNELVAFVAPTGTSIGTEAQHEHVDHWRKVWDDTYCGGTPEEPDFVGWLSSYTGEPIPAEEMREWVGHTVRRIEALSARRVVDAGVGVGLFLRELAPRAEAYYGLDLSAAAVDRARRQVSAPDGRLPQHITLRQGDALDLSGFPDSSADLVVINSVAQYFPHVEYLRLVLREAVRVVGPRGAVFVGDVRDLALLDAFHADVQVARAAALTPGHEVAAAATRARAEERELCVSTAFFTEFAAQEPLVGGVRIELKRGHRGNELTRFRYDVTLLGRERTMVEDNGTEVPWGQMELIEPLLSRDHVVTVTGIPNCRLTRPIAALRLLQDETALSGTAWDLERLLWEHDGADMVDPEDLALLGERYGRRVSLRPATDGDLRNFDAIFSTVEAGEGARES